MKNIKYFTLFFFLCIGSFSFSSAEEYKITAVFPTWEPYGYLEDGKATGFEIEIFAAVMNKMNIKAEFVHQPWKRCLHSVKIGWADVVISALKLEERTEYLYYPDEPISISKTALFTSSANNIVFNGSFEDLKDFTIGVTNGFSYGSAFDSSHFLNKDASTETESIVTKVLLGRIELGVGNIAVIKTIAKKSNASHKINFLNPLLHSKKLYAGFSKANDHKNLTARFSLELSQFKTSSQYKDIMKKYSLD